MHELSICQRIVKLIEAQVGERTVVGITLQIGGFAGVEISSLEYLFPFAAKNTVVQDAILTINHVTSKARCNDCQHVFSPQRRYDACPECEAYGFELLAGDELNLISVSC